MASIAKQGSKSDARKNIQSDEALGRDSVPNPNPNPKAASKVPKLCSLPPTTEVFQLNVRRTHFQCAIWRRVLMQEPQNLDPNELGGLRMK